jgi:hypothetical protein
VLHATRKHPVTKEALIYGSKSHPDLHSITPYDDAEQDSENDAGGIQLNYDALVTARRGSFAEEACQAIH